MNNILNVKDENNNNRQYKILSKVQVNNNKYVLFTDESETDSGDIKIFSGIYEGNIIRPTTNIDDKKEIDAYLKDIQDDIKAGIKFDL